MSDAEFIIAEFLLDNSVECVPSSWVVGRTQCWWPKASYFRLRTNMSAPSLSSNEWELLKIKILGKANNVFQSCQYSKCNKIESSEEPVTKRKRKTSPRKFLTSFDEDFGETFEHGGCTDIGTQTSQSASIHSSPSSTSLVKDIIHPKASSCHCDHFEKLSKGIISKLTSIEQSLQSLLTANASASIPQLQGSAIDIDVLKSLPHTDIHSLIEWSEQLKRKNKCRDLVVEYFNLIGGSNYRNHIMCIMSKLMVDDVASQFTLLGRRHGGTTKLSFKMLDLDSVIRDAICKRFSDVSMADIERTLTEYLKLAAQRKVKKDSPIMSSKEISNSHDHSYEHST